MVYNTVNISYTSAEPYAEVDGTVWVGETLYFSFSSDVEFSLENKYNLLVYLGEEDFIVSFFPLDNNVFWKIEEGKLVGLVTLNTKQLIEYYDNGIFVDNIKFALYNNNAEPIRLCYGDIYCNGKLSNINDPPIDIDFLIKTFDNHKHTGLDGSKKISHNDLLEKGTKSHSELETDISNINSDILFVKKDIEDINSTVESLSATVGDSTFLFLKNNNEHKDFETRMDNTDSVIKTLENRIIGNESTFQSKLDQNSQEVENVKNKNYLQKTIADGLYLAISEYNKKIHCNILAPVNTLDDLPDVLHSTIGDIRLVLSENTAYVRYYDDDGSGVNGWAALGGGIDFDNYYTKSEVDNNLSGYVKKEDLNNHANDTSNPHKVKVEQITKKSASAGSCGVEWGDSNYYKQGYIWFYFDPAMYRRGTMEGSITMPDYTTIDGVNIGGETISFNGECVFAEQGNHSGWIFRSTTPKSVNGLELYVFASVSVPDLLKKDTSYAVWVGVGTTTNPTDYSHSAEVVTATFDSNSSGYSLITESSYTPSGIYKVLTEEMLRDEETGLPYTLKVSNGNLKLVRYREESFEG